MMSLHPPIVIVAIQEWLFFRVSRPTWILVNLVGECAGLCFVHSVTSLGYADSRNRFDAPIVAPTLPQSAWTYATRVPPPLARRLTSRATYRAAICFLLAYLRSFIPSGRGDAGTVCRVLHHYFDDDMLHPPGGCSSNGPHGRALSCTRTAHRPDATSRGRPRATLTQQPQGVERHRVDSAHWGTVADLPDRYPPCHSGWSLTMALYNATAMRLLPTGRRNVPVQVTVRPNGTAG